MTSFVKFLTDIAPTDIDFAIYGIQEGWYYSVIVESKSMYTMKMNWDQKQIEITGLKKNDKVIIYRIPEIECELIN